MNFPSIWFTAASSLSTKFDIWKPDIFLKSKQVAIREFTGPFGPSAISSSKLSLNNSWDRVLNYGENELPGIMALRKKYEFVRFFFEHLPYIHMFQSKDWPSYPPYIVIWSILQPSSLFQVWYPHNNLMIISIGSAWDSVIWLKYLVSLDKDNQTTEKKKVPQWTLLMSSSRMTSQSCEKKCTKQIIKILLLIFDILMFSQRK